MDQNVQGQGVDVTTPRAMTHTHTHTQTHQHTKAHTRPRTLRVTRLRERTDARW